LRVVKTSSLSNMISPMVSSCSLIYDMFIKKMETVSPFVSLVLGS
jgi:hypothetical protein